MLNGEIAEHVMYGDTCITLGNGQQFESGQEFAEYLAKRLELA